MISPVIEKRIEKLEALVKELEIVCEEDGWTDYAIKILEEIWIIAYVLEDDNEDAETILSDVVKKKQNGFLDEKRIDDEENGGHGNTSIPFGLCEREGIPVDPGWTPRDAWDALAKKGYSPASVYEHLKKTGYATEETEKDFNKNKLGNIPERVYKALKSKRDEAIFFSNCASFKNGGEYRRSVDVAKEYAETNKGTTMGMLLSDCDDGDMEEWDPHNSQSRSTWTDASRAFAEQASGDVRVIMRPPLRKGNIFETVEFPTLKKNQRVTSVVAVNPDTGETTVLLRRRKKKA